MKVLQNGWKGTTNRGSVSHKESNSSTYLEVPFTSHNAIQLTTFKEINNLRRKLKRTIYMLESYENTETQKTLAQ